MIGVVEQVIQVLLIAGLTEFVQVMPITCLPAMSPTNMLSLYFNSRAPNVSNIEQYYNNAQSVKMSPFFELFLFFAGPEELGRKKSERGHDAIRFRAKGASCRY